MTDTRYTPTQIAAVLAVVRQLTAALDDAAYVVTATDEHGDPCQPYAAELAAGHAVLAQYAGLPPACGQAIDAAIPGACERPAGHPGPCRAYSLETDATPNSDVQREADDEEAEYQREMDRDYPVPAGLRRRDGVEAGCGKADCASCYEPI